MTGIASRDFTIYGALTGGTGANLIKNGADTVYLYGANTITGSTTINGGTLAVGHPNAFSAGSINQSSGIAINGGTLSPGNSIGTVAHPSMGVLPRFEGVNVQLLTVRTASSSRMRRPLDFCISTLSTLPVLNTRTRSVTVPCQPWRAAAAG